MSGLNVLVVGASITGPTAAYWLAKAGANVTVIERWPELRPGGQAIDIRLSGVKIMRLMPGMEEAVLAVRLDEEGISFLNDDNKVVASMGTTGNPEQQSFTSEYEILRGDLAKVLYDLTKDHPRIKYVFGEQISSMQQDTDKSVRVEFSNGYATQEYDLVVGCDGATSRTRAMAFNCSVRDHVKPVNSWMAFFSIPGDLINGSKYSHIWSAGAGRAMGFSPARAGKTNTAILGCAPRNGTDATKDFRDAQKQGDDAVKQYIVKNYTGIGWRSDEVLQGMTEATDFYATEVVQVKLPTLSTGRIVFAGDAGYCPSPFTGAGTTMAMTGAYVLAGEIAAHDGDLAAGLKAYEERMWPIIDRLHGLPPFVPAMMAPMTQWGIWLRNTIVWAVTTSGIMSLLGRLFGGSLGTDKAELPDYKFKF